MPEKRPDDDRYVPFETYAEQHWQPSLFPFVTFVLGILVGWGLSHFV